MASHAVSRPVVVDVTSEETGDLLRTALGHGFDVVLANKKPLAGVVGQLRGAAGTTATRRPARDRYEATVGAGLPIIDTYHKLVETGDRVLRIEGCVSGTLMYVVSAVSAGRRFSEAVREAVETRLRRAGSARGPVGRDAARKALILARLLGYRGPAPTPDDLVPRALEEGLARASSSTRLPAFDDEWADARSRASGARPGAALRRHGDAAGGVGEARRGSRVEPDGRARRARAT